MATTETLVTAQAASSNDSLQRFWILLKANYLMYLRNKTALFWVVLFPIGLTVLFGLIWGSQHIYKDDPTSPLFISYLVPNMIVLSLMSNGLIGNSAAMAVYRERGILRRVQTTTLPVWQLLVARILMQSTFMIGQAFILIFASILIFKADFSASGLVEAIPVIILGAVLFMAMGMAIAALVSKSDTVNVIAQVVYFPLMFLGGLAIPLDTLPRFLGEFGQYLPSALMADLVRAPMLSGMGVDLNLPLGFTVLGVVIYLALCIGIATRFFKWN